MVGITAGELVQKTFKERTSFLNPWLLQGTLSMVHAWRGVGKTFFSLAIAQAVASGSKFLKWNAPGKRRVIYFDGEMGESRIKDRLIKVDSAASFSAGNDDIAFINFEHCGGVIWNLADRAHQQHYTKAIQGFDLVVIDNISTCVRPLPRETEKEAWLRVQQWAITQRSAGKSVLFVHHSGKNGTQRGISDREDALDTVIHLKRSEGEFSATEGTSFELHFEKSRDFWGQEAESLFIELVALDDGSLKWLWQPLNEKIRQGLKHKGASDDDMELIF